MYKQASKLKLRFQTNKGILSVEQLWDLSQKDLVSSIQAVKKLLKTNNDDELSFLEDNKVVDVENQLRFDVLKDVYLTIKKEREEARNQVEAKAFNQKILSILEKRKEENLEKLSESELINLLK